MEAPGPAEFLSEACSPCMPASKDAGFEGWSTSSYFWKIPGLACSSLLAATALATYWLPEARSWASLWAQTLPKGYQAWDSFAGCNLEVSKDLTSQRKSPPGAQPLEETQGFGLGHCRVGAGLLREEV